MSTKISGNITKINDTEFTFTPTTNLDDNTKYKMVVSKEFKSDDGISLNSDFKSVFTTISRIKVYGDMQSITNQIILPVSSNPDVSSEMQSGTLKFIESEIKNPNVSSEMQSLTELYI